MRKLMLEIDALRVESFQPTENERQRGTVHGQLTAYYELCHVDDTWQNSCTCEPTCNAQTCWNCSAACPSAQCTPRCQSANPSACCHDFQSILLTNCSLC